MPSWSSEAAAVDYLILAVKVDVADGERVGAFAPEALVLLLGFVEPYLLELAVLEVNGPDEGTAVISAAT